MRLPMPTIRSVIVRMATAMVAETAMSRINRTARISWWTGRSKRSSWTATNV
jgi:hypothetical protein